MANIKISELTALTPPDAADLVPVTDSSASQTKRTTVGEIVGIVNGDVDVANDGTATISELPVYKLQDGSARQLLQTDAAGTGVEWTSNVDVPGTLDVTGAATLDSTLDVTGVTTLNAALNVSGLASLDGGIDVDGAFTVADTSGNIATSGTLGVDGQSTLASAAVSDLISGRVVLAGTSGELEDNAGLTFNGTQLDVGGDVVIAGDLTVEGASTILETETVKVEDKNIELGVVASPTDGTADGGGITLKGATDKTLNWLDATDSWTSSENFDLASGKSYRINNTEVLNSTTLGSGVTGSSLTSVGTISSGTWQGTAIDDAYLDTISTAGKVSNSATTATSANTASAIVARDGTGNFSAGTITAALTGNADTATALSSNRTFAVTGDVTGTVSSDLTSGASIATSIASGVIVDGDVNASAAIAGTKISPDFGSQAVTTTGLISADGKVSFPLSTAALPSLYPGSDTNTGIYSPGADTIAISTAGSERLRIDSSGNVGIGTTSPAQNIHVTGNQTRIFIDSTNSSSNTGVSFGDNGTTVGGVLYSNSDDALLFQTNGTTERVRIDSSGRLLIGTSSAQTIGNSQAQLEISTDSASGYALSLSRSVTDIYGPQINLRSTRGTAASPVVVDNGDQLGSIAFYGYDGTDSNHQFASIVASVDGTPGNNDCPGRLVFSTTADGASSPTERMRITNGGNIRIGSALAYASEFFTVNNGGTLASEITAFGGSGGVNHKFYFHNGAAGNAAGTVYWTNANSTTGRSINAGGTINASGADYAEYMVKAGDFTINKGDICGVTSDGLLTLIYQESAGFLVKSTNPSYVGNDGWGAGYEDDTDGLELVRKTVDRIAFAGQVPVNVMGAVPGQYIVPTEAADGGIEGVAKNEADLTLAEYMRAVGKVIAIEDDGRARIIVKVA
jgi:hypothetical protein